MNIRILAIVPSEGLRNAMRAVAEGWEQVDLHVLVGNLDEGAKMVRGIGQDHDAVISRGGTAELIRQCCTVPVVEMGVSSYDMLRTIMLAQLNGGKLAIVGFPFISASAGMVKDLFQYQVDIFPVHSQEEIGPCLERLKGEGYSRIIGDMITCDMAERLGMDSTLITSGVETIENALRRACEICAASGGYRRRAALLEGLIEETDQLVFAFDEGRSLVFCGGRGLGRDAVLDAAAGGGYWELPEGESRLLRIKGWDEMWLLRRREIQAAERRFTAFYARGIPALPAGARSGVSMITTKEPEHIAAENYMENSRYMRPILDMARKFSKFCYPVLLVGERGVGKDTLAFIMKNGSSGRFVATAMIDCILVQEEAWLAMLNDVNSLLFLPNVMFYYRNFELLSPTLKDKLVRHISRMRTRGKSFQIIAVNSDSAASEADCLLPSALNTLQCNTLFVPSLRARRGDIPQLATLYISELNNQMGTEAIRLSPKAMALLQAFSWPGNLYQFKRILMQLLSVTDGPVIGEDSVRLALRQESNEMVLSNSGTLVNTSGTLEDIERRIIHLVLKEENMNQTKAAARLGISRSTLWRKLSADEGPDQKEGPGRRRPGPEDGG